MIARVISTKMQKTAVVVVEGKKVHPLYKKAFVSSKKFLVDDPLGVKDGDMVEIVKIAPVSKNKHFRILKVVGKNLEEITEEKLKAEAKEIVSEIMPEKPEESVSQVISQSAETEEKAKKPIRRSADKPKIEKEAR